MLAPVSNHEANAEQEQRQQECKECGSGIVAEQQVNSCVVGELPEGGFACQHELSIADEIRGQVEPDEEEEATDIVEEVKDVVTLIAQRGGQVVGSIALDVVVLDVVVEVAVPGVAHERIEHVWEGVVEPCHVLSQDTSHVDVLVHHEGVGTDIAEL